MKPSAPSTTTDYKAKYYELRRTVKELVFENSAYHNEITECQQKVGCETIQQELSNIIKCNFERSTDCTKHSSPPDSPAGAGTRAAAPAPATVRAGGVGAAERDE